MGRGEGGRGKGGRERYDMKDEGIAKVDNEDRSE